MFSLLNLSTAGIIENEVLDPVSLNCTNGDKGSLKFAGKPI